MLVGRTNMTEFAHPAWASTRITARPQTRWIGRRSGFRAGPPPALVGPV
ncbi:MAG: hypothetical protein ACMVO3_00025 [Thalassobaculum sp.]